MRRALGLSVVTALLVAVTAVPAGAQQLVDAAGENGGGGLAFVLMAAMVMLIAAALFFMDRVRRRSQARDESPS